MDQNTNVTNRLLMPALFGLLLCAPLPVLAQIVAAAEPAVPNIPRAVTPQSVAAPQAHSPDASQIDASDGKSLASVSPDTSIGKSLAPVPAPVPADVSEGKSLDAPDTVAPGEEADSVVVTVNDDPVSEYEIRQRIGLFVATGGPQLKTDEDRKRVRLQILEELEQEKMQFQEAQKKRITVSPVEVDKRINGILSESHITLDQMRTILENAGSNLEALRTRMTAQIAWGKAVQEEYANDINITPADIDAELARAAEGARKTHYLVGEIFLSVDKSDQDAKVQKDAQNLYSDLQAGASFPSVARQFSQNPTAAQGGQIGLVYDGQLAPELNAALAGMKKGEVSKPIRSSGGYYILLLADRLEPLGTKIDNTATAAPDPDGSLPLARLLLPLPPDAPQKDLETVSKVAGQILGGHTTCEKLADLPKQIPMAIYSDLGVMKLKDLDPQIQKALAASKPGEMATPIRDSQGIELIARCDPRVEVRTAFTMPSREDIQNQLFDQQISALARRYLRDIKRDADVEVR